jgi:hypothetical protein
VLTSVPSQGRRRLHPKQASEGRDFFLKIMLKFFHAQKNDISFYKIS